ncbi:MAG TPA: hypothetical protein VHX65_02560 [Pirellulales bacterium]|nr:hypothetical protein [Pirellulales bacterium]
MLRLRTVCLVAVALAAGGFFVGRMLVAQDKAEKSGRDRGGFRGANNYGLGKLTLLQNKDVQKDLELTDEQKTTLDKFAEDMHSEMRTQLEGLRDLSREERQAKIAELAPKLKEREKEVEKKLEEVLKTEQRDRLGQIELQARRVGVFGQKEVAEALDLTDEEKQKIKDLRDKMGSEMREMFQAGRGAGTPGAGGPSEEVREKIKKLNDETMDKAKEVLSSEQREKLDKMLGKKFEGDLPQMGFGGPGGRGGRRGRGAGAPPGSTPEKSAAKPADKSTDKPAEKTDAAPSSK